MEEKNQFFDLSLICLTYCREDNKYNYTGNKSIPCLSLICLTNSRKDDKYNYVILFSDSQGYYCESNKDIIVYLNF